MENRKEKDIILYPDKIYTSYFAVVNRWVPRRMQISIATTMPTDFKGTVCDWLKPPQSLLWAYKNGEVSEELYIEVYIDTILSILDPEKAYSMLQGKVLCCWEKSASFCHRHIVTEWFRQKLGNGVIGGELR